MLPAVSENITYAGVGWLEQTKDLTHTAVTMRLLQQAPQRLPRTAVRTMSLLDRIRHRARKKTAPDIEP